MDESQSAKYAIIVACPEVPVSGRLLDLVKQVWKTGDVKVMTVAAPERVFAEAADEDGGGPHRQNIIEETLRDSSAKCVALVAHSGCKMSTGAYTEQMEMLRQSIDYLHVRYPDVKTGGIWIDDEGSPLRIDL